MNIDDDDTETNDTEMDENGMLKTPKTKTSKKFNPPQILIKPKRGSTNA